MKLEASILIPVFNRRQYIADCVRSAARQTFQNFEIVIVDNCSNDGTWEICKELASEDQRIRLYRNELNIGPVKNWMRCANEANGEFSKILFSDDELSPTCLYEMITSIRSGNHGLVYSAARIGANPSSSLTFYSLGQHKRLTFNSFMRAILNGEAPVSPGAALIRTADVRRHLLDNFNTATHRSYAANGAGPDVMLMMSVAREYDSVLHIPHPLVFFRSHPDSFTIQNSQGAVAEGYYSALSYFLKDHHMMNWWLRYVARHWLITMKQQRRWKAPKEYLIGYEGVGTIKEILGLIYNSLVISLLWGLGFKRHF